MIERAGVNAAQSLFEKHNWIFQPVNLENDYGKDAYVDAPEGAAVTGLCAALQIKSGAKYRRADGYAIPVEGHERVWRESPLPVMGIVHDQDLSRLYWCNITAFLQSHRNELPPAIPVSKDSVLDEAALRGEFLKSLRRSARDAPLARSFLDLCSDSQDLQVAAIFQSFAAARTDARSLILVRRSIKWLDGPALLTAIHILSLATPRPDVLWNETNRLPDPIRHQIATAFRWSVEEAIHLLQGVDWEEWHRGGSGEDLYMLLIEDPDHRLLMARVLPAAMDLGAENAAMAALYLLIYWSRDEARETLSELIRETPSIQGLPLIGELMQLVNEFGYVYLFE